ncbi:MAG: carboxy terminal-processing peptidase [Thermoguttaceae bacterium]
MKTFHIHIHIRQTVLFIFLSSLLFFTACQRETSGQPTGSASSSKSSASPLSSADLLPLSPTIRERNVANLYLRLLETQHISQKKLTPEISKEAFRLYIKGLDPFKMYFNQSDIDEFTKKYETTLCELAKQKNVDAAFEIYNRFLKRVEERIAMIMEILDSPHDFTVDEDITRDKKLMNWAQNDTESYEKWRKRIKDDILALKSDTIENKKEREKAIADGKKPPKASDDRDPVERLKKRYTSIRKRMLLEGHIEDGKILEDIRKSANDDVMEAYLSAISGALDPHTSYMSPSTLESFNISMGKALEGIGATLTSEDGYTVIKKLVKGGPADKSGELHVDDKISGVGQGKDGKIEDVVDSRLSDVVKMIRGSKGTSVLLEVIPAEGGTAKIIEIVRDKVTLEDQAAKSKIFEVGAKADGKPYQVGVIDLPDFYLDMDALRRGETDIRSTTTDVKKILKEFVEKGVDVVVLDLRMNGGGSLQEAILLTGLFIDTGNVVQTKDETGSQPQQRDDPDPSCDWTGPLVVVESKFSASASEIFAGAIKDYGRGLIVGDSRTHGKGTVQQMKDLSELLFGNSNADYGAIKITIQGFYRPSGVSPQGEGVAADVILPSLTDVLEDICESDLDNALTLKKVPPAKNFAPKQVFVSPQIIESLKQLSTKRIAENEDFLRVVKDIEMYKEIKAKKMSTLHEGKYLAEQERLNADKKEREQIEDMLDNDIKQNFYLDEVLAISVDYLKLLERDGIKFPQERMTTAKPSFRFLFGQ